MRIIYDYQIFILQEYGGISRYFYELAQGINRLPDAKSIIIGVPYINRYLLKASETLKIIGFFTPKLPKSSRIIGFLNSILVKPLLIVLRPDVVHETYYLRCRKAPKSSKVVVTVFDMIHELFPSNFERNDRTSRDKLFAVQRADHIICISQSTRNDLIRLFKIEPQKISVIHLGFSLNKTNMQLSPLILNGPYILYVGMRTGYKNFLQLLKSFSVIKSDYPQLRLVCFGGGEFSREELLLAKERGLFVGDMVQMSGSDAVLANLYTHAQAFVYPSLYEGFGIPPLEAMSCGCPVICSNSSSIPEVVDYAGVYFDPNSEPSMTKAIKSLLDNPSLKAEMICAGYERIKNFSWERCARETKAIYDLVSSRN